MGPPNHPSVDDPPAPLVVVSVLTSTEAAAVLMVLSVVISSGVGAAEVPSVIAAGDDPADGELAGEDPPVVAPAAVVSPGALVAPLAPTKSSLKTCLQVSVRGLQLSDFRSGVPSAPSLKAHH